MSAADTISKNQIENIVSHLRFSAKKIQVIPGLEKISKQLKIRADGLKANSLRSLYSELSVQENLPLQMR